MKSFKRLLPLRKVRCIRSAVKMYSVLRADVDISRASISTNKAERVGYALSDVDNLLIALNAN